MRNRVRPTRLISREEPSPGPSLLSLERHPGIKTALSDRGQPRLGRRGRCGDDLPQRGDVAGVPRSTEWSQARAYAASALAQGPFDRDVAGVLERRELLR